MPQYEAYRVWDAGVRWFHWINFACVLGLIAVGTVILNAKALGVTNDGKILLKIVHVYIGYVFAANLLWRLVWAFIGGPHARWRALLPGGRGYLREVGAYVADVRAGRPRQYLDHNPLGRIAVAVLLLLLLAMGISGMVLAGTDIFYPPLGSWIANWIAAPGVDPATLVPYAPEMYDKAKLDAMRELRKPFSEVHKIGFYALLIVALGHIVAVVITELREGGNLVSAMISGKKVLSEKPADGEKV